MEKLTELIHIMQTVKYAKSGTTAHPQHKCDNWYVVLISESPYNQRMIGWTLKRDDIWYVLPLPNNVYTQSPAQVEVIETPHKNRHRAAMALVRYWCDKNGID